MAVGGESSEAERRSEREASLPDAACASPVVFMFPGQSSRDPRAIERLVLSGGRCREILECASNLVGRDLRRHYRSDNHDIFQTNRDVQLGTFLANYMYAELLREVGVKSQLSLGLSLGEYNHLVEIGALSWEEALHLVSIRGEIYDNGPSGAMAAFAPVSRDEIEQLLARAASEGEIEISNFNTPTQFVVAGEHKAVNAALAIAEDEFLFTGVLIEQHIPMHCRLFAKVAEAFRPHLLAAPWREVPGPYIANVTATITPNPKPQLFIDNLTRHVYQAVLWRQSIEAVVGRYSHPVFIEVGPQSVLFNMLDQRWICCRKFRTGSGEEPAREVERIAADMQGAYGVTNSSEISR
jgi:[acyl-carrier-protein] S-malonyltransferase